MSKLINLSEKYINLKMEIEYKNHLDCFNILEEEGFTGRPISYIENDSEWQYFIIHLSNRKEIYCPKNSRCEIRKIEKGPFADNFCLIEQSDDYRCKTKISIIHKDGILVFPEYSKTLSLQQVDSTLDYENFVELTARILHRFDISRRWQMYETFCESLPKKFWHIPDFVSDTLHKFNVLGTMELEEKVNEKFIKLDECSDEVKGYFIKTAKKNVEFDKNSRLK